ncbi:MAG: histidine kinase [Actinobacteria bacterium]|jgi:signal transduction histidine kinase|nr:histidine kinase [Actinomycetota bacterium]
MGIGLSTEAGTGSFLRSIVPPVGNWRFWVVQLLVLIIFTLHQLVAGHHLLPAVPPVPHVAIEALFLIPILYAALYFGVAGSAATALWASALTIGGLIVAGGQLDPWDHGVVLAILDVVAVFVGLGVTKERVATHRYLDLFESNQAPIVIVDAQGAVKEANSAAVRAFAHGQGSIVRWPLAWVVGTDSARQLMSGRSAMVLVRGRPGAKPEAVFRAEPSNLIGGRMGAMEKQIVFEDVTEETRRQQEASIYAAHVLQGQEEERRRIAQELHDEPVQALVQLCRKLDAVDEEQGISTVARMGLREARDLAEDIVLGLREIARGLRPPALDHLGLVPTTRRLLEDVEDRSGIHTSFVLKGEPVRMDSQAELALFRMAQEAMSNIERHSEASHASLVLTFSDREVDMVVSDDGVGFSVPPSLADAPGATLGLRGMAERAQLLGGTVHIVSVKGKGTSVHVKVPLKVTSSPPPSSRVPSSASSSLPQPSPSTQSQVPQSPPLPQPILDS